MDIFWNYTILLVKRGTRLLKFQPMHCTVFVSVVYFQANIWHVVVCFALTGVFFNTPGKSVERFPVEREVAGLITVTVLILKTTKQ